VPRETRELTAADILPPEAYEAVRAEERARIMALKRFRRVEVGPHAAFYFESYDTMWLQVQEMLRIEKGGAEQIVDEIAAYGPLVPKGRELVATLMFEVDQPAAREALLRVLTGVERTVYMEVGAARIAAEPEKDVERTKTDGKTSSVHFLRFPFTEDQIRAFRDQSARVLLGIGHPRYAHMAVLSKEVREALAQDFA
jgi:hypothetical protein